MAATVSAVATIGGAGHAAFAGYVGSTFTPAVGDWLVLVLASSNDGSSGANAGFSGAFSSGFTADWTTQVDATYDPGVAGDGISLIIATAQVTASASGSVIIGFNVANSQCAGRIYKIVPGSGETISLIGSGSSGGSSTTAHNSSTVSVTSGDIIFGCAALETNDTVTGDADTTNGSWSAIDSVLLDGGTDAASAKASSQYKTVSSTGNQQWNATTVSARDSKTGHIILRATVAAFSLLAAVGSYTLTGTTASPIIAHKVAAAAGSYALSGTNATFKIGGRLTAAAGSYALTGTAATITHPFKLAAGAGSYALSGTNASTLYGKKVQALVGAYHIGGTDAALTKSGVATAKTLAAGAGSYTLTGNANLVLVRTVTTPGSYLLTGTAASPLINSTASSADGRPIISRTGEGYSEEDAKEARRNKWEAEQFRLKLDAMYDGREYVEQPFPEDITPAQRAAAAAQAAAERATMFQAMLTEQQARQRANVMAQQFAMRQAQDEEDAATIAVMGD